MTARPESAVGLSPQEVAAYHRDGFVVVRGLYPRDEMARWKTMIHKALAQERDGLKSGVRVWMADQFPADLRPCMADPHVVAILNQLIGPNVEFLSAKAVFKDAKVAFHSPWHHDWFYWYGAHKLSIWIAVDDASPENGCLKMIPGSHKRDFGLDPHEGENAFVNRIRDEELEGLPVETLAVEAGDAVFFHDRTVHSSYPNTSGRERMSLISTYRDASVEDDSTVWPTAWVLSGKSVNVKG